MDPPAAHGPPVSRRRLLGGVAGLAATRAIPTAEASIPELTVMTRNLYVGVDLFDLLEVRSMADVRRIAGRMLADVETHPYTARIEAIAAEIEATRPDVVGLQEAGVIRTRRPPGGEDASESDEWSVVVDLLDLLVESLAARGRAYEVAAATVTTDVEVPADADGERADVRLTDRTAILVREDVDPVDTRTGTFDAAVSLSMGGVDAALHRGYCRVDVTSEDRELTVATTHLESVDATIRRRQARELLEHLPADRPVVLAGDLNSGPGTASDAYDLLTDAFADAYAAMRDADGYTCCHAADLQNDDARLSRRIDVVLYRGDLRPTAVERVGAAPSDRVAAEVDGETVRVWPSDHAGVVATFETSSTTETPTPRTESTPGQNPSNGSFFSFGIVAAMVALLVAALTRRRRTD